MNTLVDSTLYAAFRANVARLMDLHGISQVELAARSGVRQSHISQILTGKMEPRLSTVQKIAEGLGQPATFLLATISEKAGLPT